MKFRIVSIAFLIAVAAWLFLMQHYKLPLWGLIALTIVYIHSLVLGAIYIQWNFFIKSVNSVSEFPQYQNMNGNEKRICLTFDDGIHSTNTAATLDILRKKNIKAHFFVIGKNIKGNEEIIKTMQQDGHSIGNHSYHHAWNFDLLSTSEMQKEIEDTNKEIEAITGVTPTLFRPPYGVTNPNLARAITNTRLMSMGWNLRSMDTVAQSKEALLNKLIKNTAVNSVILLHDRCDITVSVLTQYIDYCLAEGYTFVTLKSTHEA